MKKFFNIVLIISVTLFCVTAFCFENIKRNSVYYAKNTPHKEGTEPVLMMVVDNLDWIYTPEIKTLKYDFDGPPCVQFYTSNGKQKGFITPYCGYDKKNYMYEDDEWEISLILDCNFNPDITQNHGYEITKLGNKGIKQSLYNKLQPIIDAQRKPKVNLQWLFDIVYKNKFN